MYVHVCLPVCVGVFVFVSQTVGWQLQGLHLFLEKEEAVKRELVVCTCLYVCLFVCRVLHKHLPDCLGQVKVRFGQAF